MEFEDFCKKGDIWGDCKECLYKDISDVKKCRKQFDLDNLTFITNFDFKCMVHSLEEILDNLNQKIEFIYEQLD